MTGVLLFIVIAMISILVHEFGHALVGRRLGGGRASIVLWSFGGLAYSHGGRFTRTTNFWRVAAGPGAGFVLLLMVIAALCIAYTPAGGIAITSWELFHHLYLNGITPEVETLLTSDLPKMTIIHHFLVINFWWGVLNLLPVLPLDGGRIADLYVKPQRRVYLVGVITGVVVALYCLSIGRGYTAVMFGYLAFQNYQNMQNNRWI